MAPAGRRVAARALLALQLLAAKPAPFFNEPLPFGGGAREELWQEVTIRGGQLIVNLVHSCLFGRLVGDLLASLLVHDVVAHLPAVVGLLDPLQGRLDESLEVGLLFGR